MISLVLWGLLLISQNAAFTLVSRARNSKSLVYNAGASVLSNGIWFASQLILVDNFVQILKTSDWWLATELGVFYTACTIVGSVSMQYIALHYIEGENLK